MTEYAMFIGLTAARLLIAHLLIQINPVLYKTVTLFEAVALIMAAAGLIYADQGIRDAKKRLRLLLKDGRNGPLKLTADENLRVERNRRDMLLCVLVVAALAVVLPNRTPDEGNWAGSVVSLILMYWVWLLASSSYRSKVYRDAMVREIDLYEEKLKKAAEEGGRRKDDVENANEVGLPNT